MESESTQPYQQPECIEALSYLILLVIVHLSLLVSAKFVVTLHRVDAQDAAERKSSENACCVQIITIRGAFSTVYSDTGYSDTVSSSDTFLNSQFFFLIQGDSGGRIHRLG